MSDATGKTQTTATDRPLSPEEIRGALASIENGMRMLSKAIHRFQELQSVNNELRYDVSWTNYLVQLRQAIDAVGKAVNPK